MKLKTIFPMLLAATISVVGFNACKQENLKPEGLQMNGNPTNNTSSVIYDTASLKNELKNVMVSFVNDVRFVYNSGMSFSDFKNALIGSVNVSNLSSVADELLEKTFYFLSINANENQIKEEGYKVFGKALKYVLEYSMNNGLKPSDKTASIALFGGNENAFRTDEGPKPCKWYQIGCHLSNVINWIEEHPQTVQLIITIITIIL